MNEEHKQKIIGVRLPLELYERLKKKFPLNFSDELRKHFERILFNAEEKNKKYIRCLFPNCNHLKDLTIEDVYCLIPITEQRETTIFLSCPYHRKQTLEDKETILKEHTTQQAINPNSKQTEKVETRLLIYHLMKEAHQNTLPTYIKLIEMFPKKWSFEGHSVISKASGEEIEQQLLTLNKNPLLR